jgi:hypothetical protein
MITVESKQTKTVVASYKQQGTSISYKYYSPFGIEHSYGFGEYSYGFIDAEGNEQAYGFVEHTSKKGEIDVS